MMPAVTSNILSKCGYDIFHVSLCLFLLVLIRKYYYYAAEVYLLVVEKRIIHDIRNSYKGDNKISIKVFYPCKNVTFIKRKISMRQVSQFDDLQTTYYYLFKRFSISTFEKKTRSSNFTKRLHPIFVLVKTKIIFYLFNMSPIG